MVDAWTETALVTIAAYQSDGATDTEFYGAIDSTSLEITVGEKDFDIITLLNGGCIEKPNPEGEYTISFDMYPIDLDTSDNSGIFQFFHTAKYINVGGTATAQWDTSEGSTGLSITNTRNRDKFRVAVLFTDDTNITAANSAVPIGSVALRFIMGPCRLVSMTPLSFGDRILKVSCKFKAAPYTKSGAGVFKIQSSTGTVSATLGALASYTSINCL